MKISKRIDLRLNNLSKPEIKKNICKIHKIEIEIKKSLFKLLDYISSIQELKAL